MIRLDFAKAAGKPCGSLISCEVRVGLVVSESREVQLFGQHGVELRLFGNSCEPREVSPVRGREF